MSSGSYIKIGVVVRNEHSRVPGIVRSITPDNQTCTVAVRLYWEAPKNAWHIVERKWPTLNCIPLRTLEAEAYLNQPPPE